jgi:hypothetical protein
MSPYLNKAKNLIFGNYENKFYIYEMSYFDSISNKDLTTKSQAIELNTFANIKYKNTIQVPTQPLENGQFTNDSIITSPFIFTLEGIASTILTTQITSLFNPSSLRDRLSTIENQLDKYLKNNTLLVVLKSYPLLRNYTNLKLIDVEYSQNNTINYLRPTLTFQQVRVASVEYNNLKVDNISDQTQATSKQNGQVTPQKPDKKVPQ